MEISDSQASFADPTHSNSAFYDKLYDSVFESTPGVIRRPDLAQQKSGTYKSDAEGSQADESAYGYPAWIHAVIHSFDGITQTANEARAAEQAKAEDEKSKREADDKAKNAQIDAAAKVVAKDSLDWFHSACNWISGAVDVGTQIVCGGVSKAWETVTEHPLEVAAGVALGIGCVVAAPVAVALGASAAIAGGIAITGDVALLGMTAFGAVTATVDTVDAAQKSAASVDVLMHKDAHSEAEVQAARAEVQQTTGKAAMEVALMAPMLSGVKAPAMRVAGDIGVVGEKGVVGAMNARGAQVLKEMPEWLKPTTMQRNVSPTPKISEAVESSPHAVESKQSISKDRLDDGELDYRKVEEASAKSDKKYERVAEEEVQLPPGSAVKLLDEFDSMLEYRQSIVNVGEVKTTLANLDTDIRANLREINSAGKGQFTEKELLNNVQEMRDILRDTPQAKDYESYLKNTDEEYVYKRSLEREMELRRNKLADIINENAPNLFPEGTVPKVRVERLVDGVAGDAAYGKGAVKLSDDVFENPSYLRNEKPDERVIDSITHETKHAEQEGLMIRRLIDNVTGRDTTGRALTQDELEQISGFFDVEYNKNVSEELIKDINVKRGGKLLTQSELDRTKILDGGYKDQKMANLTDRANTLLGKRLKIAEEFIRPDGVSPEFFSTDFQKDVFGARVPQDFQVLKELFDSLPKGENGNLSPEQTSFAKEWIPEVREAMSNQKAFLALCKEAYMQFYRSWAHEKEAWSVGGSAAKQVDDYRALHGDKLQQTLDEAVANVNVNKEDSLY